MFGLTRRGRRDRAAARRINARRRALTPLMEGLEGRVVLSTFTWIGPSGGDWNTIANWDQNQLPTGNDDVLIPAGSGDVHVTNGALVRSLTTGANTNLQLSGGYFQVNADSTIDGAYTQTGGALAGVGTLTINGNATWSGGQMHGSGATNIKGELTLDPHGAGLTLDIRTLNNEGVIKFASNGILGVQSGATINNDAEGAFTFIADTSIKSFGGDPQGGAFNNEGILVKTGGPEISSIQVPLTNSGLIRVESGTLDIAGPLANYEASTRTLTGGSYEVAGTLRLQGSISVNTAEITLTGPDSNVFHSNNLNALSSLKTITEEGSLTLREGNLKISGSLTNEGRLVVESGTLSVKDDFRQTPSGSLTTGIGGPNSGIGGYGKVAVDLDALLDGALHARLINGYAPTTPQTFTVLSFDSRRDSTFASVVPQNLPAGMVMNHAYGTGAFILTTEFEPVLETIVVTPGDESVAKGLSTQFTATGNYSDGSTEDLTELVDWSSSNELFASIDSSGLAKSLGVGSSTITATLDGVTGSATLHVTAAELVSIAVTPLNSTVLEGSSQAFQATGTYTDETTGDVTDLVAWSSSNLAVATIDGAGLATALLPGSTAITASHGDLAPASASLTVEAKAAVASASIRWGSAGTASLETAADGLRLLPAGRSNTIGWYGIDRVGVTLDKAATLTAADVVVSGLIGGDYGGVTVTGSGTTWLITLARPIDAADSVTITIGNAEVATFTRRLDILPGDVNDDGVVTMQDAILVRNGVTGAGAIPDFVYFVDVLGDLSGDQIATLDGYNVVRRLIGSRLPLLS